MSSFCRLYNCTLLSMSCRNSSITKSIRSLQCGRHLFSSSNDHQNNSNNIENSRDLSKDEVARYSPQLLCPGLGRKAQLSLKSSSVLVVGLGGLGTISSQYLTSSGIGKLGLIDQAKIDLKILQRQVLYGEEDVGKSKALTAAEYLKKLNSNVSFDAHDVLLSRENAMNIVEKYDIVVDATDNPVAKYLINDVCLLLHKPMITGSAIRYDGYVTMFNYDQNSPCYRCALPKSVPSGMVTKVADAGILSPLAGMIGSIQATEAIKIAAGLEPAYNGVALTFSSLTGKFENIQIQKRHDDCQGCGKNSILTRDLIDYDEFCGVGKIKPVKILSPDERVTVQEYQQFRNTFQKHLLIDVRPRNQQEIVKLENAITITLEEILKDTNMLQTLADKFVETTPDQEERHIFVMCRRGIASQRGVREIQRKLKNPDEFIIRDIEGGIEKWAKEVDQKMPIY